MAGFGQNPALYRRYIRDQRRLEPSPSITPKGHWMVDFGFETGKKVEVLCEHGELSFGWLRNDRQIKRSRPDWAGIDWFTLDRKV